MCGSRRGSPKPPLRFRFYMQSIWTPALRGLEFIAPRPDLSRVFRRRSMFDAIFIAVAVGFFLVCAAYAAFCERA